MEIEKTCEYCGRLYIASRSSQKFCSDACRQRAHRKKTIRPCIPEEPAHAVIFAELEDAVSQARSVSNLFAQLSNTTETNMRAACFRISLAIHDALEDEGL